MGLCQRPCLEELATQCFPYPLGCACLHEWLPLFWNLGYVGAYKMAMAIRFRWHLPFYCKFSIKYILQHKSNRFAKTKQNQLVKGCTQKNLVKFLVKFESIQNSIDHHYFTSNAKSRIACLYLLICDFIQLDIQQAQQQITWLMLTSTKLTL